MKNNYIKKSLVLGIISLFIGTGVTLSISGNVRTVDSSNNSTNIETIGSNLDILTFYPTDDTFIKDNDKNYGSKTLMQVRNDYGGGNSDGWAWDTLIKFDVSSIPSDTIIRSAKLNLYYYDTWDFPPKDRNLSLTRAMSDWDEDNVTGNTQPYYVTQPTTYSTVPKKFYWMTWDVTDDVQDFIDETETNYGWKIADEDPWRKTNIPVIVFYSKEYNDSSFHPYLEILIDDTPPECEIEIPRKWFLYICNFQKFPLFVCTFAIGHIRVEVEAFDEESGIESVEIYVDKEFLGEAKWSHIILRYVYVWDETRFGQFTLKAVAKNGCNLTASDKIVLWYFNIEGICP